MNARTFTPAQATRFWDYFALADELSGGLTLEDMSARIKKSAHRAADELGLSWPPRMAEAEEYALRHRDALEAGI